MTKPVTPKAKRIRPSTRKPGQPKRGPLPWQPTTEQIEKIKLYAGLGSTQEQIGTLIGISVDTLSKNSKTRLAWEKGQAETIAKVAGTLVKKALAGDTASAIFYLKTQAGWKETVRNEQTGADGGPIQYEQVSTDADDFTRRIAGLAARDDESSGNSQTQH